MVDFLSWPSLYVYLARSYLQIKLNNFWINISIWTTARLPIPKPNSNTNLLTYYNLLG